MTEDPTEKSSNESGVRTECPADPVTKQPAVSVTDHQLPAESKEFEWSKSLQGLLLSCFFYGYILTQIIGGYFSDKVNRLFREYIFYTLGIFVYILMNFPYLYFYTTRIYTLLHVFLSSEVRRCSWWAC